MTGLRDAYDFYRQKGGTLPYNQWKELCEEFNNMVIDALLDGERVEMGSGLSYLQIIRDKNEFKKPSVDWKASYKLRQELLDEGKELFDSKTGKGEKWLVYFTNEYYFRYYWNKKYASCRNSRVYQFIPARGNTGAKTKLVKLLTTDELSHMRFADAK